MHGKSGRTMLENHAVWDLRRYQQLQAGVEHCFSIQGVLEQSAVDPWQKSKREVQRNSGELLHSLSQE
ncbi:hypothetical protein NDU88_002963 [Pleurodeles waltl]|uniref:Uncharacterized protein n=1 Tax=Pleurodeles waltl TaxID=8319 RepID=A0AAV7M5Q8_PLEWA|nr:hypothetical protein NDU88_002963 [Pleurodeles waltl]